MMCVAILQDDGIDELAALDTAPHNYVLLGVVPEISAGLHDHEASTAQAPRRTGDSI